MAAVPGTPARLVRDARLHGPNRKVSQLMNLEGLARHPVLVVADGDEALSSRNQETSVQRFRPFSSSMRSGRVGPSKT